MAGNRAIERRAKIFQHLQELKAQAGVEEEEPVIKEGDDDGDRIKVTRNCLTLWTDPDQEIFKYEIRFAPKVDDRRQRIRFINEHLLRDCMMTYNGFDKLYIQEMVTHSILRIMVGEPDKSPIILSVIFIGKSRLSKCIDFYNTLFENCFPQAHLQIGEVPKQKCYVNSLDEFQGGVHVHCEIFNTITRTDTPLHIIRSKFNSAIKGSIKLIKCVPEIEIELLGRYVLTLFDNNLYRIDAIHWTKDLLSTFTSSGQKISYIEYFLRKYGVSIEDYNQPFLICMNMNSKEDEERQRIRLIPELCYMTDLTDSTIGDFTCMKYIGLDLRTTPEQNIEDNFQMFEKWGLNFFDESFNLD